MANAKRVAATYSLRSLQRIREAGDVTKNGVAYDWSLAGSAGAVFTLIRERHHSDEDIAAAVSELRMDRDVVGKVGVAMLSERTLSLRDGGLAREDDDVLHPEHGQVTLCWDAEGKRWGYFGSKPGSSEAIRGADVAGLLLAYKGPAATLGVSDLVAADDYVRSWGTAAFADQEGAWRYAKALEKGEGGLWRAEESIGLQSAAIEGSWRAHRVASYDEPTMRQWREAIFAAENEARAAGDSSLVAKIGALSILAAREEFGTPAALSDYVKETLPAPEGRLNVPRG